MKQRIFIPTVYEILYLFLMSVVSLAVLTIGPFMKSHNTENYRYISSIMADFISKNLAKLSGPHWTTFITAFIWMIVGALTYSAIWVAGSVIHAYRNDVSPHGFLMPQGYNRSSRLHDSIGRSIVRSLAAISVLAWLVLFFKIILPYANNALVMVLTQHSYNSIYKMVLSLIVMMLSYYLFIVLIRLIYLRKRLFS